MEDLAHLVLMLCRVQPVPQAAVCDCLVFDPFAFEEDGLRPSEVDVSWGKIVEALVISGWLQCATKAATWRSRSPGR